MAVAVTPVIFFEIPSWREPRISHLNPLCWDYLMTRILYADDLPAVFGCLSIIYKDEKIYSCRGKSFPEWSSSACNPRGFCRCWWLPCGLWTWTTPFLLLACPYISYWSLLLAPGPSNTELNQGRWSNWKRENPKYLVWYLLSPGHHFMAEIFGVFSINSWVAVSKTAVVSKPWR